MEMHKRYLVVFRLPAPRIEHAALKDDIERYSNGNFEKAFFDKSTLAYFFTSNFPYREMTFNNHLFREDSYLLTEVSMLAGFQGFDQQVAWLRKPQPWS